MIRASEHVLVIVSVYMDRPAILTNLLDHVTVLTVNFGITDKALVALLRGEQQPAGTLPSGMEAVESQHSDVPYDSLNPLYPFGFGLTY